MVPKNIQPYFKIISQKNDGENSIVNGELTCCNATDFEIAVVGIIKESLFSKMYLYPEKYKIAIEARCRQCGKVISVYDSSLDGYERYVIGEPVDELSHPITCKKCQSNTFSVGIKYEYPDVQELKELGIADICNAFTWRCVSLKCKKCRTKYKNFIECETD